MEVLKLTIENALEIFTGERLYDFLKQIEDEALKIVPDVKTTKGRAEIASNAHVVAKKKVEIDIVRKALVADWKNKARVVDASGKKCRDFLDDLKIRVREPLTIWEDKEKARIEAEKLAAELEEAMTEAIAENAIFDREKEIERKEAKMQAEREAKLEEERLEIERQRVIEREKTIAKKAKEKAEKAAVEELERVKREKIESELKAKQKQEQLERDAAYEKQKAVEAEREAGLQRERNREAIEIQSQIAAEKKAANLKHRKKINNEAL
ncbi:MAG: hypothetical protein GY804_00565, partial [Alphaproteobacteria bacterium]|nr:hypothetical protein [Alphaproteobacteria bacterium]